MVFKIEVLAIYEEPGTNVTGTRRNQRDQDFALAQDRLAIVGRFTSPDEFIDTFEGSKYGFGWKCAQFVNVRQDGDDLGLLVANRLDTRGMKGGSKVEVFEHLADEGNPYQVGALLFERTW
jgi:hypothetical protein